ncbi:MAG: carbohydrate binding family 9 domain-containing protein, partial [Deltaproteobacteria bacterium]|nr:carbohydrate binding family 9 domain-containing protein [Deltaproteobacteria bacterium]
MLLAALAILTAHAAPVHAVEATGSIAVDGVLDEASWALAEPVTEFLRFIPSEGGAPPGVTEVRFLQDDTNLYVGVRVSAVTEPVRARYSPRESINEDDQVGLYLDTFRDRRSGYIFYFNPLGIQQDIRFNAGRWNPAWDTVLRSRGRVTEDGYEIEIAVPFRSLKYPSTQGAQEWGLLLTRRVPGEGAKYSHPPQERDHPQLFDQATTLVLTPPKRGSGLELMPTLTAIQTGEREARDEPMSWTGFDPWHQ